MQQFRRAALLAFCPFAMILGACENQDAASNIRGGGLSGGTCAPGVASTCACPGGAIGSQVCALDGLSFGACSCGDGSAGVPAQGGVAGTIASGGAGFGGAGFGSAGTDGSAGTLGTAGTDGSAGTLGTAGTDGSAGTLGSAGSSGSDGSAGTTADPPDDTIPANDYCAPTASWDAGFVEFENQVLVLVNENRAKGWNCDTEGQFGAAGPLTMNANLRCAARVQSKDMNDRGFFDHTNPDGDGPSERMDAAGYVGSTWGENIAMGQQTPEAVVMGWMNSDGHCANIMNPNFTEIGVGYFSGSKKYWTQTFGAPCTSNWCM